MSRNVLVVLRDRKSAIMRVKIPGRLEARSSRPQQQIVLLLSPNSWPLLQLRTLFLLLSDFLSQRSAQIRTHLFSLIIV
jgi:hypothetical protein